MLAAGDAASHGSRHRVLQVQQSIVELTATVGLRSASWSVSLDDLLRLASEQAPGAPTLRAGDPASKPTPIIEVRMFVTITGLPFEVPNPAFDPGANETAVQATIRDRWVEESFSKYEASSSASLALWPGRLSVGDWAIAAGSS
jgi:hypothetical protein